MQPSQSGCVTPQAATPHPQRLKTTRCKQFSEKKMITLKLCSIGSKTAMIVSLSSSAARYRCLGGGLAIVIVGSGPQITFVSCCLLHGLAGELLLRETRLSRGSFWSCFPYRVRDLLCQHYHVLLPMMDSTCRARYGCNLYAACIEILHWTWFVL